MKNFKLKSNEELVKVIKDIEIENLGKYCIVNYRLKSEVAYEIFRLESEEISEKVVKQIKEFIFDE